MTHLPVALKRLFDRLTDQLIDVVGELGRVRGCHDADAILPAVAGRDRARLYRTRVCPRYLPGDLLTALAEVGALAAAQLFAPNGGGYLSIYATHTLGMLLTGDDHDLLTEHRLDVAGLAEMIMPTITGILQSSWEDGFGQALITAGHPTDLRPATP